MSLLDEQVRGLRRAALAGDQDALDRYVQQAVPATHTAQAMHRAALLEGALALLRKLGTCRSCEGLGRYCAQCGGAKFCSCDRGGTYAPVTCTTCVDGLVPEAADLVCRAAMRPARVKEARP